MLLTILSWFSLAGLTVSQNGTKSNFNLTSTSASNRVCNGNDFRLEMDVKVYAENHIYILSMKIQEREYIHIGNFPRA